MTKISQNSQVKGFFFDREERDKVVAHVSVRRNGRERKRERERKKIRLCEFVCNAVRKNGRH